MGPGSTPGRCKSQVLTNTRTFRPLTNLVIWTDYASEVRSTDIHPTRRAGTLSLSGVYKLPRPIGHEAITGSRPTLTTLFGVS